MKLSKTYASILFLQFYYNNITITYEIIKLSKLNNLITMIK